MKKIFLTILLCGVILLGATGCESEKSDDSQQNTLSNLVDIEKIYYKENNDSSISMYLVYSIKSDAENDITVGASPSMIAGEETSSSAFYTYDKNKSIIEKIGFPTVVSYQTLYAGSDKKIKYIATFIINKNYVDNKKELILQIPIDGTVSYDSPATKYDNIEKSFIFDNVKSYQYVENDDFIQEFEKDYK